MSQSLDLGFKEPTFQWGQKKGVGKRKGVQFYHSFMFDNLEYSLFDCVYLFKNEEPQPYIGKIVKIWEEPDYAKRVKILWFFCPNEIENYLENHEVEEKEIFLACGEGVGASNTNPLEAIAGKCFVVCTSRDMRNLQPSRDALEMADYIFYRTFDVGSFSVSEEIADTIVGLEVRHLLNQHGDLKVNLASNVEANVKSKTDDTISKPHSWRLLKNKVKNETSEQPTSRSDAIEKKTFKKRKHPCEENIALKAKHHWVNAGKKGSEDAATRGQEDSNLLENKAPRSVCDGWSFKKRRTSCISARPSDDLQRKNATCKRKQVMCSVDDDAGNGYACLRKESSEEVNHREEKVSPIIYNKIVEVTRNTDPDKSKWFCIDRRIRCSAAEERMVFLENLDPSYTSSELEDIIYSVLHQKCTVRIIQQGTFQSLNDGQAYVIFKTPAAADLAVQRINAGCLMLSDGRPLLASLGKLHIPSKSAKYSGHLTIEKISLKHGGEWTKAPSTSHNSQPNTVAYQMAMDWVVLQEKSARFFDIFNQRNATAREEHKREFTGPLTKAF